MDIGIFIILLILVLAIFYFIMNFVTNNQLKKQRRKLESYGTEEERLEFTKSRKVGTGPTRQDSADTRTVVGLDKPEHDFKGNGKPERPVLLPPEPAVSSRENLPGDREKSDNLDGDKKGDRTSKRGRWKRKPKTLKEQKQTG